MDSTYCNFFKRTKKGQIILITSINPVQQQVHGYNIGSSTLRQRSFSFESIDQSWIEDTNTMWIMFKRTEHNICDCKYHSAGVTLVRKRNVETQIRQIENRELRKHGTHVMVA